MDQVVGLTTVAVVDQVIAGLLRLMPEMATLAATRDNVTEVIGGIVRHIACPVVQEAGEPAGIEAGRLATIIESVSLK